MKFTDHNGKEHHIEVGPKQMHESGETSVYLNVNHHQRAYTMAAEIAEGAAQVEVLSKDEIEDLAKVGDIRAPFAANVCEVSVEEGQEVAEGDKVIILEAMKMQTPIVAEVSGTVEKISVKVGDAMKVGDKLLKIAIDD